MAVLEADLAREVLLYLESEYTFYTEVPLYHRCIDAVLLSSNNTLITVEFKIKDWRKALRQIRTHLLAADYAYLCMPKRKISHELQTLLMKMGVGLWLFDMDKKELSERISPRPSFAQHAILREKVMSDLNKREIVSEHKHTQSFD